MNVLFLGKAEDFYCESAVRFTKRNFDHVEVRLGTWGKSLDWEDFLGVRFDLIVSYLSRWVVPDWMLRSVPVAINFHPASPDYPGIGCVNFALYEGASEYGSTCHFMAPKVDTGEIIRTARFPILKTDDVASLLERTYQQQIVLFYSIMRQILRDEPLQPSGEKWGRAPYTRKEFDALSSLDPGMDEQEIKKRIRSCAYGPWKPTMRIGGVELKPV